MSIAQFNREEMARSYAGRHLKTDPGIRTVYYLPAGAPEREVRFLEINDLMAVRRMIRWSRSTLASISAATSLTLCWCSMLRRPSGNASAAGNCRCLTAGLSTTPFHSPGDRMNGYQQVWWEQTCADHAILNLLRKKGAVPCHQLHYLQMVTEKLGKAYFWRTGHPPRTTHASFVRFLQALDNRPARDADRIAGLLGFGRSQDLETWIPTITPLAYDFTADAHTG